MLKNLLELTINTVLNHKVLAAFVLVTLLTVFLLYTLRPTHRKITFTVGGNIQGGKHYVPDRSAHLGADFKQILTMYSVNKDDEAVAIKDFKIPQDNKPITYTGYIKLGETFAFQHNNNVQLGGKADVKAYLTDVITKQSFLRLTDRNKITDKTFLSKLIRTSSLTSMVDTFASSDEGNEKRSRMVKDGELVWNGVYREIP